MQGFFADGIEDAVQYITYYLENSDSPAIYFDGWRGLGASAVLKSIGRHPPPSLVDKFSKIIHIDCSKWKSRRALQRAIAEELEFHQWINDAFDRQDKEDDFSGRDESSRTEIPDVTMAILRSLVRYRCLVIFHNGSDDMVDLVDFGIPPQAVGTKVLWTYRGRLRQVSSRLREMVTSHDFVYCFPSWKNTCTWKGLLAEEAREIALYTHRLGHTPAPEVAKVCCMYLLSLSHQGGNIIDYNWATHASNYWVCDGIVTGGHDNQAWEVARALHQEIWLDDYSSNTVPDFGDHSYKALTDFGDRLGSPPNRWILVTPSNMEERAHQWTTSLFLSSQNVFEWPLAQLSFHQLDQLHVLKIFRCSFSFQSPPFHCCHNLRFLGLESCTDQQQAREEDKDTQAMEVFMRLWVLDICYTDWELAFPQESEEETATEIREVHIKKGKIWHSNLAWRRLQNLRKLCVADPTCSWETGEKDEFKDMVNLEHLELSRNSSIQVLPGLSGAIGLKSLILDGCVLLEHVGPEGLPPSLESFSFDAGSDPSRISKISLAGCVHLKSFLLRGAFPGLEELDLSGTSVKNVDLSSKVVQVNGLNKVILIGCKQLRALLWSKQLKVLRIDTNGRNEQTQQPCSDLSLNSQEKNYDGYVIASDTRIIQSLWHDDHADRYIISSSLYLHLHNSPPSTSISERQSTRSDKDIIPKPCYYNKDVSLEGISSNDGGEILWPPPSDCHVEVSEGISLINVEGEKGISSIHGMMWLVQSMHVHDNSCMLAVNPKSWHFLYMYRSNHTSFRLRWCRVERCPKLQAVFMSYGDSWVRYFFPFMEIIWASHLPMAGCIWSKGLSDDSVISSDHPFGRLQSIHIHNCPRLKFILPLYLDKINLPSLEALHITHCGHLRYVFPWDDIHKPRPTVHRGQAAAGAAVNKFPMLKHIHLHDLPSLQEICEDMRMLTPVLESVELRGCWALRRLPAVGHRSNGPPAVVCIERDCWEKLEWDGWDVGHDPSLYEPRFSSRYYRKERLLRGTVLR
ncbi:hypothetical protein HU200_067681 [Digitaria exilis]|uniref:Disease resistance protein At4g27190-like leucine-rich repeats domain-containing protein n=1 Tax=Digitaria exilis TaxID=1010633 RepID=A0A835A095_9POAL|nr:hypothetical protein HU200_067681 [Digitaria exilis]